MVFCFQCSHRLRALSEGGKHDNVASNFENHSYILVCSCCKALVDMSDFRQTGTALYSFRRASQSRCYNLDANGCQLTCSTCSSDMLAKRWARRQGDKDPTISGTSSCTLLAPRSRIPLIISRSRMSTTLMTPSSP